MIERVVEVRFVILDPSSAIDYRTKYKMSSQVFHARTEPAIGSEQKADGRLSMTLDMIGAIFRCKILNI